MTAERHYTLAVLIEVFKRAENPAEHRDIEAWIDARRDGEGGFLWLAARLSLRPSVLEQKIRSMLEATKSEHKKLQRNIETAQKRYGD